MKQDNTLNRVLDRALEHLEQVSNEYETRLDLDEIGNVIQVGDGVATVRGLPRVQSEELVEFPNGLYGMAFNLDVEEVGVILLGDYDHLEAGDSVRRTGRVTDMPVGDNLLGRVVDPTGHPLDRYGAIQLDDRRPIEREAPDIMDRAPVSDPLQTGLKAIDALLPIGRGQRELIIGDRQTGKTAIALDTIINQRDKDVICVYCAIGQEKSTVARFVADLRKHNALDYCVVISATGDSVPGLQYIAPYSATSIAEHFMDDGRDVLIVYDDLTKHARAYRELSLLLRRPPGREAYPGDIFYIHSRLLERSTHLRDDLGSGSLTALPIVETHAQNISAYIPTNLISITDGQIYLSPTLFQKGILPAIDIGRSVSRVGGKAQLPAYQAASGDLRLAYSQFEELEAFSRFGTRLDEETQHKIERGRRVREILKQPQYQPITVPEQIAVMIAVTEGLLDDVPLDDISEVERQIRQTVPSHSDFPTEQIFNDERLSDDDYQQVIDIIQDVIHGEDDINGDD